MTIPEKTNLPDMAPGQAYSWCFIDQDYGMEAFLRRCPILVMERRSYEVLIRHVPEDFPRHLKIVCTSSIADPKPGMGPRFL